MGPDGIVLLMAGPIGLILIALIVGPGFLIWRAVLGKRFRRIGFAPIFLGYVLSSVGALVASFIEARNTFYNWHVAQGFLSPNQFWDVIFGWTIYLFFLFLFLHLLLVSFVAVPLASRLIARRRYTLPIVVGGLGAFWLAFSLLKWIFLEPQHQLASLVASLAGTFPWIALSDGLFLLGVALVPSVRKRSALSAEN